MSGGSWDYVYWKVEEAAERLQGENCPHRRVLGDRLKLYAKALHDIEWVDSGDLGKGDEMEAIKAALGQWGDALAYKKLVVDARFLIARMEELATSIVPHNSEGDST